MDPSTPPLPAVNPAGGGWGSPLDGLPTYGGVLTGNAIAAQPWNASAYQSAFTPQAPRGAPGRGDWPVPALPVPSPANAPAPAAPDPTRSGFSNWMMPPEDPQTKGTFAAADLETAARPGVGAAIHNFFFNPVGSPEAAAYKAQSDAATTLGSTAMGGYLARFPSMADAAAHNPVQFATAVGPILEAHQKELAGMQTPGAVTVKTNDGDATVPVNNMEKHAGLKAALGTTDHGTALLMDPSHMTQSQWVKHARAAGITNNQLRMMWEMQHYLPPQQQAAQEQLGLAHQMYNATDGGSAAQERLRQQLQLIQAPTPALSQ